MAFDPTADGDAMITLVASLSPHYQPPIIPAGASNLEKVSIPNIGSVQLERWEFKTIPIFQDRQFLLPLATLPEVKDNQTLIESIWIPTSSVPLDLPSSAFNFPPTAIPRNTYNSRTIPPEWVAGLNPFFSTMLTCVDQWVCVGFLGGGVEVRDIRTLKARGVVEEMKESREAPHSSTLTMFGRNPPIPVSAAFSPNGQCISVLRYDVSIRLCVVPKEARPVLRSADQSTSKERQVADLFETSMMHGTDPWDIYARIYYDPCDNFLHLGVCDCHLVCILTAQDLHALDDLLSRHYALQWEPLRASLYALCYHTPNSLAYVTSSARSFIFYINDILRSSIILPLPSSYIVPLNPDELISTANSVQSPTSNSIYFPQNIASCIAPLEDWVMDFTSLLLKALSVFVLEMTSSKTRGINSVVASHVPATAPGCGVADPDKPAPSIPLPTGGTVLTPEISLSTMASLTVPVPPTVPPAPIVPTPYPPSPAPTALHIESDVQMLSSSSSSSSTSYPPPTSMELSATTFDTPELTSPGPSPSLSGTPIPSSPSIAATSADLTANVTLLHAATPPTTPSTTASEIPPESANSSSSLRSPSSLQPTSPPARKNTRSNSGMQPQSANERTLLDYHFEFLLSISNYDSPLASFFFDIPTLQVFQNVLALVAVTSVGKERSSTKDVRIRHALIGTIISKLQALLDKDPNFYKIDFVEMLALRFAESLAELVVPGTAEELRITIAQEVHTLNLDSPYTPLVHRVPTRDPKTPLFDILHFVTFTPSDGPFKECMRCGRTTRGQAFKGAVWVERWGSVCPICNGKWVTVNSP